MLSVRPAGTHAMWAPGSVRQMCNVMSCNLRGSGHLRLRQRLGGLYHHVTIRGDDVRVFEVLGIIKVCWHGRVTDICVSLIPATAIKAGWSYRRNESTAVVA